MVKFLKLKVGDVVFQRSRSVRLGPSAVEITVLEIHADYALVRKGKDQPPERMYRRDIEYLHKTPFPAAPGRIVTELDTASLRARAGHQRDAKRNS